MSIRECRLFFWTCTCEFVPNFERGAAAGLVLEVITSTRKGNSGRDGIGWDAAKVQINEGKEDGRVRM